MFETWFPRHWTTIKKLIWLRATALGNAIKTVTGTIVTFVTSKAAPLINLTATLSPIQDLHGYDAPWPAGGGKNILDQKMFVVGIIGTDGEKASTNGSITDNTTPGQVTLTLTANWRGIIQEEYIPVTAGQAYTVSCGSASGVAYTMSAFYDSSKQYISDSRTVIAGNTNTATAPTGAAYIRVSFQWATAGTYTITGIQLEKGSATTFTPYANICPISGHTGVTVDVSNKNLFNVDDVANISVYSTEKNGCYFRKAGTYTVSAQNGRASTYMYCRTFNADGSTKTTYYVVSGTTVTNETFTILNGEFFAVYDAGTGTVEDSKARFAAWECQVELGSTASEYVAYTGNTYPITFPDGQTVYSGTLSVNEDGSGVLTADYKMWDLPTATNKWALNTTGGSHMFFCDMPSDCTPQRLAVQGSYAPEGWISCFKCYTRGVPSYWLNLQENEFAYAVKGISSTNRVWIQTTAYETVEDFIAAISGAKMVYELAEPITYNLTAEQVGQIMTLKGNNVMWVDDSDEISVTYYE